MKKIIVSLFTAICFCNSLWSGSVEVIEHDEIPAILQSLPHEGVLMQRQTDGYIYLKVSDEYLNQLFEVIKEHLQNQGMDTEGLVKGSSTVGAHMSVIRPSKGEPLLWDIEELGQVYSFEPLTVGSVVPDLDPKWERVWILELECPEARALREKYHLGTGIAGTDNKFHMSIATKLKSTEE